MNSEKPAPGIAERKAKHLGGLFPDFLLLWSLLKDYRSGRYRSIPWKFLVAIFFAVGYLIMPVDAIPDFVPFIGYIDDAGILALVLKSFQLELNAYRLWLSTSSSSPPSP